MKLRGEASFIHALAPRGLLFLSVLFSFTGPVWGALIFLDDFEGEALNADITEVPRTPTVGPLLSAKWYHAQGTGTDMPTAKVVARLDGKASRVDVPRGCALDYWAYLDADLGNRLLIITWDMEVAAINGGGGMFFIRFPALEEGMQVLFGFLDNGWLIRFSGPPSYDTLVRVGTFQGGTRYSVWFAYNLVSKKYSAVLNGVKVIDNEPIPSHFNLTAISAFGFDINQSKGLPDNPAQGNTYYVDNIRFDQGESVWLPLILKGI